MVSKYINIDVELARKGMTIGDLAERVGVRIKDIRRPLQRGSLDTEMIVRISNALGCDPVYLSTKRCHGVLTGKEEKASQVRQLTEAEATAHILRGLISYHERMHGGTLLHLDGSKFCEQQADCPAANHDPYLQALRFALAAVERENERTEPASGGSCSWNDPWIPLLLLLLLQFGSELKGTIKEGAT